MGWEADEYEQMSAGDMTHIPSICPRTCMKIKCMNILFGKQGSSYSDTKLH